MSDSGTTANYIQGQNVAQTQIQTLQSQKSAIRKGRSEAPTGLLTEFLSSIMIKDYQTAFKYCAQILSYEPNNATARDFYPLILEKLEMISNEESDNTSSDSSDTYSTDSKSSQNSLSDFESQSSEDDRKTPSGDENSQSSEEKNAVKDNDDSLTSNLNEKEERNKRKEQTLSETIESTENQKNSAPPAESSVKPPQAEEKPQPKENSKEPGTQLPSKFLIHSTKTKILKFNGATNEKNKNPIKSKKQVQIEQRTATVSQKQSSSKVLLYPTRTVTFPKVTPEAKFIKN